MSQKVACIIPTYNGASDLKRLLETLTRQKQVDFDIFVVDSSSKDGTAQVALDFHCNLQIIRSSDFNHGATRQMMIDTHPGYDVYVLLTQDAYLASETALSELVSIFANDPRVGAAYGRQLPHLDASPLAAHARIFNYPEQSQLKSKGSIPALGIKTAFMSNSFSAYRGAAIQEVGGFPSHVILGEDMYVAAKMILAGWKIAYQAAATCHHSHNYTVREEFSRYFDIGVFQKREPWIIESFKSPSKEGFRFVASELKYLGARRLYLWPSALLRNAAKIAAFKFAKFEDRLSPAFKHRISMSKQYWRG